MQTPQDNTVSNDRDLENQVANAIGVDNMDDLATPIAEEPKSDLFLFKTDCLSCSHLCKNIEGIKLKAHRCTKENGNERCPAAFVTVSVGVDVEKIAKSLYRAKAKFDMEAYGRRMIRLAKYPQTVQRRVMERVDEMVAAGKE